MKQTFGHSGPKRPARQSVALLRREFSASLPWLLFFCVSALVRSLMVLDDDSVAAQFGGHDSGRVVSWLLALICGAAIGDRDARNGAVAFLETLPVKPVAFFGARVVTGVVVFVAADLGMVLIGLAAAPAWHSSTASVPLAEIASIAAASFVADVSGFCVGLLCAPLRQLTGLIGVVVFVLSLVATELRPDLVPFAPGGVGEPHAVGGAVVFVGEGLVVHGVIAVVAVALAALFASQRSHKAPATERRRRRVVLGVVAALFGLLLWAGVPSTRSIEFTTRHARFTTVAKAGMPPPLAWADHIDGWRVSADADLDAVEAGLGARFDRVLRVDVSGQLTGKHGQATGTAIALDEDAAGSRFVLAHEAVHALAFIASDGATADDADGLEIFSEGLANHIARGIAPDAPPHPDPRPTLARLARQGRLDDRVLVDADAAAAAGDPVLVYGIGEELVGAMIDVYGHDAPLRFLQQLRPAVDDDVKGIALWHATLARADMLFAPIAARFFVRVGDLDGADAAPFVSVRFDDDAGGGVRIDAVDEFGVSVDDAACRARNRAADPAHKIFPWCLVPFDRLAGGVVEVQVVGPNNGAPSRWLRLPLPQP